MPKPTNAVERVFDSFLSLSTEEQKEFRTLLRGREWAAPPAQATIPIAAAAKRSHKKPKTAPAQAEEAEAKSA
jgi:hypothetical protein